MRMMLNRCLFVVAICCAFAACAGGRSAEEGKPPAPLTGAPEVQRVTIVGGSYFFKPSTVVVKVNQPVELTLSKESGFMPHNFVLKAPEAGIDIDVSLSTDPKVVRFIPTKAGRYPFYCAKWFLFFKTHRERGMEGTLEVME